MKNGLKVLSFFRNVVFLKWSSQIIFLVGLLYIIWSYIQNAVVNLEQTNIAFSWGWLGETPGVSIAEGMYTLPNSGRQMLQVGMINMLRVTVTGIIAATFLGTFLGIARLSKNYIVEKTSTGLLEVVRNVPLLVQIFFFQAFVLTFPRLEVFDVGTYNLHVSAKGIAFPWLNRQPTAYLFWVYLLAIFLLANRIYKWRVQILEREGRETRPFLWSVGIFFGLLIVFFFVAFFLTVLTLGEASTFSGVAFTFSGVAFASSGLAFTFFGATFTSSGTFSIFSAVASCFSGADSTSGSVLLTGGLD